MPVVGLVPRVRLGIATGIVVVGDLIGEATAQERNVLGETPNLAARLQSLADPGTVVIDTTTRRLAGGLFEYRDLGVVVLKGFAEPVPAYQVLRPSSVVESRSEALSMTQLIPLVGREEEIDLLLRRWRQARDGSGRVVLLSGEPGIGKSRLTAALQEKLQAEPHIRLRYFCSPYHSDTALHPIVSQLERAAGFERDDTAESKLVKLEELLAPTMPPDEDVALLAELLSVPINGRLTSAALSPQRKKEKTLEALLRQLSTLARRQPVLMEFEDAHWIDPTSRELLDLVVKWAPRSSLLLLITFRPEFQSAWTGPAHVTLLALHRLERGECACLVRRILGTNGLPDDVVEAIVHRTDGVPLFIEELTKAVAEVEGPELATRMMSTTARAAQAVPVSLHASLMARLDRLGTASKEVAQIGAGVGREFSYEMLSAIGGRTEDKLRTALDRLVEAGLLFCRGVAPRSVYLFKHALVQDAAYGTLLRGPRQELHDRIAAVLEARFPEIAGQQPALLAQHCTKAGQVEKAAAYWERAGRQSLARSATAEALSHFRKGLDLVALQPDEPAGWRLELPLRSGLGVALASRHGVGGLEAWEPLSRARQLCELLGDDEALAFVVTGQMNNVVHRLGATAALIFQVNKFQIAIRTQLEAHHQLVTH